MPTISDRGRQSSFNCRCPSRSIGAQFDDIVEGLRSCADRMCCVEARCMVLSVCRDIVEPVQFKASEGSLVHLSTIRILYFVYRSREVDLEL